MVLAVSCAQKLETHDTSPEAKAEALSRVKGDVEEYFKQVQAQQSKAETTYFNNLEVNHLGKIGWCEVI